MTRTAKPGLGFLQRRWACARHALTWSLWVLFLGGVLAGSGCRGCTEGKKGNIWKKVDIGEEEADPRSSPDVEGSPPAESEKPSQAEHSFRFSFSPKMLRVYRATEITFWVGDLPPGERPEKVEWNFGDDLTRLEGEEVKYTFEGGLRDRDVTATLHYPSGRAVRVVRTVPLEKIPLIEKKEDRAPRTVPGIDDYDSGLRVVFAGGLKNTLEMADKVRRILELEPHILFVLGDFGSPLAGDGGGAWSLLRSGLVEAAAARGVWICPILGDKDLKSGHHEQLSAFWQKHAPPLDLGAGSIFPESYAFRRDGVFFATIWSGHKNSDQEILRLQSVLGRGGGDPSRVVVSYFPLAPFTEKDKGKLEKAYRFYEVMERSGVAALVSGHYGVTYLGQYGGLKSFSAGRVSGGCDLLPTGQCTPEAVVVLDFSRGKLKRTLAVELSEPLSLYSTNKLPAVLFNYRRWDPKLR